MSDVTKPKERKWLRGALTMGSALGIVGLAGYGIFLFVSDAEPPRKRAETIVLRIVPPPPPPPPPEQPPEPPKMVEEQIIEPPLDAPPEAPQDEAPPPGPLALDAQGGAGGDAFGLGARPGGRDILLGVGGGGGGGNRFGRYATLLQDRIGRRLQDDDAFDSGRFQATLRIWLTGTGGVSRVEVLRTSGDGDLDRQIERSIAGMPSLPEAPPADMPQPVIVRVGATPPGGSG